MGTLQQIDNWSIAHHPRWMVVLRVILGCCLFIKGISFMVDATNIEQFVQNRFNGDSAAGLAIAITWAHLLGGFMIIIGLMTRWAVLLQIPILLGAIFFVNLNQGSGSELLLSIFVMILLLVFLVEGGGPISLDGHYFRRKERYGKRYATKGDPTQI